ncbi:non-ribosomal peptide synthetase [Streptomyces sp. LP11]|uniref:Non-ribosomal peptide synthetase n=1 Tax=Streptomyces pyxinicus TaxID=2970331 RepID=A0ABT2AYQ7_9ACTN|nr:non-ribosomal peptide synthetase [Streptomyces sp. LP11]MCS0600843.1 non-ribosomal peptide synthetase [Streptomyces sp. LP11]
MTASPTTGGADALSRLWHEVVAAHGDRPALTDGHRTLTYRQAHAAARSVAGRLAAAGAGPGRYVMLHAAAPLDAVLTMLGTLAAGAAFAVLEDGLPEAARAARCARVDAALLVGRGPAPRGAALPWVDLGPQLDGTGADPASVPGDGASTPGGPAYAMFTSGSTGEPKAVGIGRDALHGFALAAAARLGLGPGDRWLQLASLGFDVVVEEVFPVLTRGGTVVCRPDTAVPDPEELHALLGDQRVTTVELSTQYWREYAHWLDVRGATTPAALRRVLVGGERMDPGDWRRWERAGHAGLVHVYGLTECTVTSTMYEGPLPDDATEVPIGTPLANADVSVRDAERRPVPPGTVGEIHIGGPSLAPGYLGDPEQTARRFVTGAEPGGGRLYATGDLGRVLPGGDVEFHGRVDDQIKIRGHRLEPASVERLLTADPAVAQAVVLPDTRTRGTLLACLVPAGPVTAADGVTPVTAEQRARLLAGLTAELPGWAAPQQFFWTGALPKNAHGKVDRHALTALLTATGPDGDTATGPDGDSGTAGTPGAPVPGAASGANDPLDVVLRRFRELLADPGLESDADFFASGGQSILAMRLVTELRADFPGTVGLRATTVFDHPTPRRLAQWLATARTRPVPAPFPPVIRKD